MMPHTDGLSLPIQALLTDVSTLTGGILAIGYVCNTRARPPALTLSKA
jgi:hypothetical protein